MNTYIAFLRGINVGGRNRLKMADLISTLHDIGLKNVKTYIQSGNIIFQSDDNIDFAHIISSAIASSHKLDIATIVLTRDKLVETVAKNPIEIHSSNEKKIYFCFMNTIPTDSLALNIPKDKFLPDIFHISGDILYFLYDDKLSNSKMTLAYFEKSLQLNATARNWNTVQKMIEMALLGSQ